MQNCSEISWELGLISFAILTKILATLFTHLLHREAFVNEPLNDSNRGDSPLSYDVLFNSIEYRLDGFAI